MSFINNRKHALELRQSIKLRNSLNVTRVSSTNNEKNNLNLKTSKIIRNATTAAKSTNRQYNKDLNKIDDV